MRGSCIGQTVCCDDEGYGALDVGFAVLRFFQDHDVDLDNGCSSFRRIDDFGDCDWVAVTTLHFFGFDDVVVRVGQCVNDACFGSRLRADLVKLPIKRYVELLLIHVLAGLGVKIWVEAKQSVEKGLVCRRKSIVRVGGCKG